MDSSDQSTETLVICGTMAKSTKKINERTNIEEVHEYVRNAFRSSLPQSYQIIVYDATTMSFVDLKTHLQNRLTQFQSNSTIGIQNIANIPLSTNLYVVNTSPIYPHILSSNQIQHDQTLSSDSYDNSMIDETHNESNFFLNNLTTDDDILRNNNEILLQITEDLSLTTTPSSIELPQRRDILSNRLFFSLDVKSIQRNIYKSDQFCMRSEKPNGRIARIQGVKTDKEKMRQILPKLRIPLTALQPNVTLLIVVVFEEIKNGMRIWYKHPHKGFLPEQYTKNTDPINPIELNLNGNNLTSDGDLVLSLQMITKWDKSKKEFEKIHQLDEKNVLRLHRALHDNYSPRLLCVLVRNGFPDWDTFCLSDFIRSPKSVKQRSSSVITERTCSPQRKRSKINTNFNDIDQIVQ
ncbi:unnamed protein product [Rotaria sp. Silwood2]|nr:unnamed protein product [Rotaria sp. Silwood2]CAF3327199.1 unnamed protein product [Rotaria sp. Silwood2]CAF4132670.1 unnamed protein product [Rotaria sp. Silwood2]CAF4569242.1 unnamed protein product [Rotaria sp. Silwood2]